MKAKLGLGIRVTSQSTRAVHGLKFLEAKILFIVDVEMYLWLIYVEIQERNGEYNILREILQ